MYKFQRGGPGCRDKYRCHQHKDDVHNHEMRTTRKVWITKRWSPRTEPWDTPMLGSQGDEKLSRRLERRALNCNKEENQENVMSWDPSEESVTIKEATGINYVQCCW